MLKRFRSAAEHILFKLLLGVIIVSFAIWGVGDIFRQQINHDLADFDGKESISIFEFNKVKKNELQKLQQLLGTNLDEEQIKSLNIDNIILTRMINDKLIALASKELGITVSDSTAVSYVKQEPIFLDENGKFDKKKLSAILSHNNISENDYLRLVKQDIADKLLVNSLKEQKLSNLDPLGEYLYDYKTEQRLTDMITIEPNKIDIKNTPSQTDLQSYYEEHKQDFFTPEYRKISFISIITDNIKKDIVISDEDMKKEYEDNLSDFLKPETRSLTNLVFTNEEDAQNALNNIKNGNLNIFSSASATSITNASKQSLPTELQGPVFSLQEGEFTLIIKTSFGYHIIRVDKIFPASTLSFAEAKDRIYVTLLNNKLGEKLATLSKQIEDEIASGATLAEIAAKLNLPIQQINAIDKFGKDQAGNLVPAISTYNNFLDIAFSTNEGDESAITQLPEDKGFYILKVDSIAASKLESIQNVMSKVIAGWTSSEKKKAAEKIAKEVQDQLKTATDFQNIKNISPAITITSDTINRPLPVLYGHKQEKWPADFLNDLFSRKLGEVSNIYHNQNGDFLVGVVRQTLFQATKDPAMLKQIKQEIHDNLANDLMTAYIEYIREKYPVKVNQPLLAAQE